MRAVFVPAGKKEGPVGWWLPSFFYPRNDWIGGMVGGSVLPLSERGNLTRELQFYKAFLVALTAEISSSD